MRVIVVGGGIMGLASAWALRRSGYEVALYEQGPLPNPLASSCDQHRLIRFAYGALTGYARMVVEAYAAWSAWGRISGGATTSRAARWCSPAPRRTRSSGRSRAFGR
jgi:glycine/D-amino acid oxidase-like deaminating enzyme